MQRKFVTRTSEAHFNAHKPPQTPKNRNYEELKEIVNMNGYLENYQRWRNGVQIWIP